MTEPKPTWSISANRITESVIDGERFITMPGSKFDMLAKRIADLERREKLLLAVFEAAKTVGNKAVSFPGYYSVGFHKLFKSVQAAINGGALGEGE